MKEYAVDLKGIKKHIYSGNLKLGGINPKGDEISFTNYYMELNGEPFFVICGEFHFSRYDSRFWEEEILKMKMCGVNTIATYIIWIHHEEEEGIFNWEGNNNVRHFIELCKKHDMYFILRIGPFAHGEARNGGLPDWLYGRPFAVRSNDEEYLIYVRRLYLEIGNQVKGLMFKDGGPIIGIQLENEFQAAGAPWETTPIQVLEWIGSEGGEEHMRILKKMALEAGLQAPVYTCTGWGGAPILADEVLPLYGGYAFWPWIFYGDVTEHPATREYLFQDFHNDDVKSEDFNPPYKKTRYPFACCEIGGGMQVWYNYRFTATPESVEAMPLMKVAGGCNFLGYYMFHGGSNPIGKRSYLNERTTPKISYDFQAPLGEFGQVRESYNRLKLMHYFYMAYEKELCKMGSVVPADQVNIEPTDTEALRYAVRIKDNSGFLFLNNYQDHVEMKDHEGVKVKLVLDNEEIVIPRSEKGFTLKKDVSCILPFDMKVGEALLKYSTTQFIKNIEKENTSYNFFYIPDGMEGEYCFGGNNIKDVKVSNGAVEAKDNCIYINLIASDRNIIELTTTSEKKIVMCTFNRKQSLELWCAKVWGEERIILSNGNIIATEDRLEINSIESGELYLSIFPSIAEKLFADNVCLKKSSEDDIFDHYVIASKNKEITPKVKKISDSKAIIAFDKDFFEGSAEVLLQIDYSGDVGYAYMDGTLINDNFSNGTTWEIGLKKFEKELLEKGMYVYISPIKKGGIVKRDSAMAAVKEEGGQEIAVITSINAVSETKIIISK